MMGLLTRQPTFVDKFERCKSLCHLHPSHEQLARNSTDYDNVQRLRSDVRKFEFAVPGVPALMRNPFTRLHSFWSS